MAQASYIHPCPHKLVHHVYAGGIFMWGIILVLLVLGAVFVNGWTDAPNAIASAVGTRAIRFRRAVWLAAAFNLAGLLGVSLLNASVAETVLSAANFGSAGARETVMALCAVMAAIIIFATCAWYFGIPTSESHALLAALAGASFALGESGPPFGVWMKIMLGLALSLAIGFGFAWGLARALREPLSKVNAKGLDGLQIIGAAAMAAAHGAQDGQKFAAILIAAFFFAEGTGGSVPIHPADYPVIFILCAVFMAAGTAVGGKRIVISVGIKMVPLKKYQGVCADLGAALCLLLASLTGIPVSTTHTKTSAILGAGLEGGNGASDRSVIKGIVVAWIVTFPVCGAIGYLLTNLFLSL